MIAVIDFGMGNIHSCLKAISLYTDNFKLTTDPKDLENASGIVLPGDGAFEKAMSNLEELGFIDSIHKAIEKKFHSLVFALASKFYLRTPKSLQKKES